MPKNNKKRGAQRKGVGAGVGAGMTGSHPPTDEENSTGGDNWSTASVVSDGSSYETAVCENAEPKEDQGQDEENVQQENFEDKMSECIEGLTSKSGPQRKKYLEGLQQGLCKKYCVEFLDKRKETVTDSLLKCLKRGKVEEQTLAAHCLSLLAVQLADGISGVYSDIMTTVASKLNDNAVPVQTRAQCASAMAICCFINTSTCDDDVLELSERLDLLEKVFKASQHNKANGTIPSTDPALSPVNVSCLDAWCLLMTRAPESYVQTWAKTHISMLGDLLLSSDTDLRIAAGEAIALLYDLNRCIDEDFDVKVGETDVLCEQLKELSTENTKHKARVALRQQRARFRDILQTVQDGEVGELTVRLGSRDALLLSDWSTRVQYNAFCSVLSSGIFNHLQENLMLRDFFNMGAPIVAEVKPQHKMTKVQRKHYNSQADKARTMVRAKNRDKRTVLAY